MFSEPNEVQRELDRKKAIDWSRKLLNDRNLWCIIDTETTGLNPRSSRVVELTVLGGDGAVKLETLINPECEIPFEASRIHGITSDQVVDAPTISEIWPELVNVTQGKLLIAYNSEYDRSILHYEAERCGLNSPPWNWECAMIQYSTYMGKWNSRFGNYTYQKLPSAGHRSYLDCKVTLDLIIMMAHANN